MYHELVISEVRREFSLPRESALQEWQRMFVYRGTCCQFALRVPAHDWNFVNKL
ncbi:hypothetical protein PROFUN_13766 [Planoprotostelium fungivorum]|uniref:Uncharacterized protein n=1 Tax=Planoprotostelium fungivorum TaxID=1890364 RepID=A0A2P6N254_9EUKA|nr:hypothetical protein PROFUN_13766 [Planoprotostelium fungivorum]